jgi:AraC family transcriptional regulator
MPDSTHYNAHIPLINPALTLIESSVSLGWDSILVEHVRLQAGELYVSHLNETLVCLVLDSDYNLEQTRYGKTFVHTFQPGQAQILPTATFGFWRTRQSVELLHLQFPDGFLKRVSEELDSKLHQPLEITDQFLIEDAKVAHIAYALFAELRDRGINGPMFSETLATALATHLIRNYSTGAIYGPPAPPRITREELQQAVEYIHDHLTEHVSKTTLAQLVNLSSSHFDALFKEHIGLAPHQYVLQQRIERAKMLLLRSNMSIAEVAAEAGFYDQSHLTRHMRRLLNVTPSILRRQS